MIIAFSFITTSPSKHSGISSYTEHLLKNYALMYPGDIINFITNASADIFESISRIENIKFIKLPAKKKAIPFKAYGFYAAQLSSIIAKRNNCVGLVSTNMIGAIYPFVKCFTTLHDTYDLNRKFKDFRTVAFSNVAWRLIALASNGVICVSDTTKNAAIARRLCNKNKILVIKEGSKYESNENNLSSNPKNNSFLYVASVEKNKNISCLLEAVLQAQGKVNVEWVGSDPQGLVRSWFESKNLTRLDGFTKLPFLSDEDLLAKYRNSLALVVTSLDEGFCLPVIEAQSQSTPVICSDIEILNEVAGQGGKYFPPNDHTSLLRIMMEMLHNTEMVKVASKRAFENSLMFSWKNAALQTRNLFDYGKK